MSTIFFILTPFGLFCTENGTGLIVAPIFLILGFICKWIENGGFEKINTSKVSSEEFWTIHFLDRYYSLKKSGMVCATEEAKGWADEVTKFNGGCPVSDEKFEQIAKEHGIVTKKEQKTTEDIFDRIQFGKYYLLGKLKEKYKNMSIVDKEGKWAIISWSHPQYIPIEELIDASQQALSFVGIGNNLTKLNIFDKYKKEDDDIWITLSPREKEIAQAWVSEYEDRLVNEIKLCEKSDEPLPTIREHYNRKYHCVASKGFEKEKEFDIKYGFIIEI